MLFGVWGMVALPLSLVLTFIAFLLWHKSILNRVFSINVSVLVFISLFLSGLYYVVDYVTGSGIDEFFIYHLTTGITGSGVSEFRWLFVASLVYLTATGIVSYLAYNSVRTQYHLARHKYQIIAGILALFASFYLNPAITDLYRLYSESLNYKGNNGRPPEYILQDHIVLSGRPKNLVYIYLESVEQTYMDETLFPGLMPNLSELRSKSLYFSNIHQIKGSRWTIEGMIATQCGITLVAPSGGHNSFSGVDQFLPAATCLGDLLSDQRYNLNYLGGASLDFAGKGKFYATHGFNRVEGYNELVDTLERSDYLSSWGLYDDSLFVIAQKRFEKLVRQDQPFGLFLLTLDTHHPNGHVSESCRTVAYADGNNPILNAVHCADKIVSRFIRHIMKSNAFKDTLVVVTSDHLAARNSAWDLLQAGNRKNLWMVFASDLAPKEVSRPGSMLDVSPTILSLLGASTEGLGFGRNLLSSSRSLYDSEKPISTLLKENRSFLASLWSFPQLRSGIKSIWQIRGSI